MKEVWDENLGSRQRPSKTIFIVEIIPPSPPKFLKASRKAGFFVLRALKARF
jgi:hypothetical protein